MSLDKIERANFLRFMSLFIDVGTVALLKLFIHFIHDENISTYFSYDHVKRRCQELASRNIISKKQLSIVSHSCPDIFKFDASLLITLLSNLFPGEIPPPKGGWETNKPRSDDLSVAADIVRMRLLRNEVVGHSSRAKLSEGSFQDLWQQLETIVNRLYCYLEPNSKRPISEEIESYKTMNLDENNEMNYQDKLRELRETCYEIVEIQDKVAELLQKSQEFAKFFSTKPRRFSLYVSLLTGGGHYLLAAYLKEELSKRNLSIQAVLLDKKAVLEEQLGHAETVNRLDEAIENWDISVLVTVILVCFNDTLDPRVKKAITDIHEAYLGYARLALESLDVENFSEIDGDLVNNLRILSWDLGADIVLKCEEFINIHRQKKRESTPDTDDDFDMLKSHGLKLKTLEDVYKETLNQLKEVIKKMEERGIPFKSDYVLQLQVMTYGDKKAVVEDILTTVFAAALRHESTDEYKDIREAIDLILDQIKAIAGVKVETVERHCILISIRCPSNLGLLKLIEYVESTFFQEMLYKLSTVLIASFEEVLVVTGNFNFETLHGLANYLSSCFEKEHEQGGLTLPISCSSVEGINQVLRLMAADKTKQSVERIAEHLSKQVEDEIILRVKFPDLKQCFGVTGDNAKDNNDKDTTSHTVWLKEPGIDSSKPDKIHQIHSKFPKRLSDQRFPASDDTSYLVIKRALQDQEKSIMKTKTNPENINNFLSELAKLFGHRYYLFFVGQGIPLETIERLRETNTCIERLVFLLLTEWWKMKELQQGATISTLRDAVVEDKYLEISIKKLDDLVDKYFQD